MLSKPRLMLVTRPRRSGTSSRCTVAPQVSIDTVIRPLLKMYTSTWSPSGVVPNFSLRMVNLPRLGLALALPLIADATGIPTPSAPAARSTFLRSTPDIVASLPCVGLSGFRHRHESLADQPVQRHLPGILTVDVDTFAQLDHLLVGHRIGDRLEHVTNLRVSSQERRAQRDRRVVLRERLLVVLQYAQSEPGDPAVGGEDLADVARPAVHRGIDRAGAELLDHGVGESVLLRRRRESVAPADELGLQAEDRFVRILLQKRRQIGVGAQIVLLGVLLGDGETVLVVQRGVLQPRHAVLLGVQLGAGLVLGLFAAGHRKLVALVVDPERAGVRPRDVNLPAQQRLPGGVGTL